MRLSLSENDLWMALTYVNELVERGLNVDSVYDGCKKNDIFIFEALVTSLVISYARPFTSNKDREGKKRITLKEGFVPKNKRCLHKKLMSYRNTLYAHSDVKKSDLTILIYKKEIRSGVSNRKRFSIWTEDYIEEMYDLVLSIRRNIKGKLECHEKIIGESHGEYEIKNYSP